MSSVASQSAPQRPLFRNPQRAPGPIDRYLTALRGLGLIRTERTTRALLEDLFGAVELAGRRVLEIGGGEGIATFYAAHRGARQVVCLEPEAAGSADGVTTSFARIHALAPELPVVLDPRPVQDYRDSEGFDVILMNASINHVDEEACIRLHQDEVARVAFRKVFVHIASLARPAARLIVVDCARRNFFAALGLKNPIYPDIEWHKHQPPGLWAQLLGDCGFKAPKISWSPLFRFGAIGRVLSSSAPAAYFLKSMFRLEMQKA